MPPRSVLNLSLLTELDGIFDVIIMPGAQLRLR